MRCVAPMVCMCSLSMTKGTDMTQQERARRTRERVLTAAAEVFASQGYSRATLSSVADRIGMTKGALYGHFSSKRSLAGALIDESR